MDHSQRARETLLAGLPVGERRRQLAGVSTAVLEGGSAGDGSSIVLLHGPGEFAATWLPVLPGLARAHHVVVPDLPGHGESRIEEGPLDAERVLRWLDELIEQTCPAPPVLVGRTVGGAIAARFAAGNRRPLAALVLVDTLGLTAFDPAPRFGIALHRFLGSPTRGSYERLMEFCAFDLDRVREHLGARWDPFAAYAVELAGDDHVQAALGSLIGQFAAADPTGAARPDRRAHRPDLGPARPRDPAVGRGGGERPFRVAAARRRERRRRSGARPAGCVRRRAAGRAGNGGRAISEPAIFTT